MKKKGMTYLLLAVSLILAAGASEAIVRFGFPSLANMVRVNRYMESAQGRFSRFDQKLGWIGIPDARGEFLWPDTRSDVCQNRFGFRGAAHSFPRTGARRIVCLGDSFVWGFGVSESDLFSNLMEKRSRESLEMVNLGVSGYGTDQEYLLWKEIGARWQPDEVLLFVTFVTDLYENTQTLVYGYPKPVFRLNSDDTLRLDALTVTQWDRSLSNPVLEVEHRPDHPIAILLDHSYLACLAVRVFMDYEPARRYFERNRIIPVIRTDYGFEYALYEVPQKASVTRAWHLTRKIISRLADDVRKQGGRLILVIVPSAVQVYPEVWQRFALARSISASGRLYPAMPNRILQAIGKDLRIDVIDLLPDFLGAAESNAFLYFPFNRHWTAAGHRVVSNVLLRELSLD